MKIQRLNSKRFTTWVKNHKIPIIIVPSIILVLSLATMIIFVFILLASEPSESEPSIPVAETTPPPPPRYFSDLSGLEIASADLNSAPITCIMIENSPSARPHSGLGNAAIIYEAIAEGGITRFLTVWQNSSSPLIGPVRSLRLYYLEWAAPFDCAIAHVGGSEEALNIIRNPANSYRDIDQFFNGSFYWRATDRYAPHNVYTNSTLMQAINDKRSYTTSSFTAFPRTQDVQPSTTPTATTINIKISSANYNPVYTYSPDTNSYLRAFQNGQPHMTTTTCTDKDKPQVKDCVLAQLSPSIVIAMTVRETGSIAEPGREAITTTGSGVARIFQNGGVIEGIWSRPTIRDQIIFTDAAGDPIQFIPGQIWISAVPSYGGSVTWQ